MKNWLWPILLLCVSSLMAADLSSVYEAKKQESSFSAEELKKLKNFKVLLIPGVLSESLTGNNQIKLGFIFENGFNEQKKLMEENKIDYEYVKFDSESSIEINAQAIALAIESSSKPVLIYNHSKGGLDTLEALRQKPELINKIHGWVTVQSPFWGSPIADMVYDSKVLRKMGTALFEWFGGDVGGITSLTIRDRSQYMETEEIKNLIKTISKKIKFLNYASYKRDSFGVDTPLELLRDLTLKKSGPNDGVVPLDSARMNAHGFNVDYVIENGVDHLMTATKYRPDKMNKTRSVYNQQIHTMSLLKMIL